MNFKKYIGKIQGKIKEEESNQKSDVVEEANTEVVEKIDTSIKKTLDFVDTNKDPHEYLKRYLNEPKYKDWFNRNYPNHSIYDAVGLSISDYLAIKGNYFPNRKLFKKMN